MTVELTLEDPAATEALGKSLAATLPEPAAGWTMLLEGELGAGKSSLVRAMLAGMGHDGPVPSPTYTLVEPYEFDGTRVYHVDLYRIGGEEELRYLGWNEFDGGLRLVEWPDRAPKLSESADIAIRLAYAGTGRTVRIEGLSTRGGAWLESIGPSLDAAVAQSSQVSREL